MPSYDAPDWIGLALSERYRIESKLGEGGMGAVYRAHDHRLDTPVVIKVPLRSVLANPEFAARFAREIRSLVKLSHPHVVRMLDVGEYDGIPFAVMQFLAGGSLEDARIQDPSGKFLGMPPESLRKWIVEIAAALDFVHGRGYVHRDVKPANILFDEHGNAYLSDFGVARAVTAVEAKAEHAKSLTGTGLVLGTPRYMAPELVMSTEYDGRIDQYALAITVHELLAGRPPIDAATPAGVLVQQTVATPPSLADLNRSIRPTLAAAVLRALSKNPAHRYPKCAALAADIIAALDGRSLAGDYGIDSTILRAQVAAAVPVDGGVVDAQMTPQPMVAPTASPTSAAPSSTPGTTETGSFRHPSTLTPAATKTVYRIGAGAQVDPKSAAAGSPTASGEVQTVVSASAAGSKKWMYVGAAVVLLGGIAAAVALRPGSISPDVAVPADQRIARGEVYHAAIQVRNLSRLARPLKFVAVGELPPGFELDQSTGDCRWTPGNDCPMQIFPIEVQVETADRAPPSTAAFRLTVFRNYKPPVTTFDSPPATASVNDRVNVSFAVHDPEGDSFTVEYQVETPDGAGQWLPAGDARALAIDVAKAGDYYFRVRAKDAFAASDAAEHRLSVVARTAAASPSTSPPSAMASSTTPRPSAFTPYRSTRPSPSSSSPSTITTSSEPQLSGKTFDDWMEQFRDNAYNYYYRQSDLDDEREALMALVDMCRRHAECRKELISLVADECRHVAVVGDPNRVEIALQPERYFAPDGLPLLPRELDTRIPVQGHVDALRAIYLGQLSIGRTNEPRTSFAGIKRKDLVYISILNLVGTAVMPELIAAVDDPAMRGPAFVCLSQMGQPAVAPLLPVLKSATPESRFAAVWTLAAILQSEAPDAAVTAALKPLLDDTNTAVREAAVRLLIRTSLEPDVQAKLAEDLIKRWEQPGSDETRRFAFLSALKLSISAARLTAAFETFIKTGGKPVAYEFRQLAKLGGEGAALFTRVLEAGATPAGTVVSVDVRLEALDAVHYLAHEQGSPPEFVAALGKAVLDAETRIYNRALQRLRDMGAAARAASASLSQAVQSNKLDATQRAICDAIMRNIANNTPVRPPAVGESYTAPSLGTYVPGASTSTGVPGPVVPFNLK